MNVVYIGLGSNLENPLQQLRSALDTLDQHPKISTITPSYFYGSSAVGPGEQPDYVNAAAYLQTEMDALPFLDTLQGIESKQGRQRGPQQWLARTLDLDILLFNNDAIDHPRLQVPHPRMTERHFVLQPLLDINPHLVLPNGDLVNDLINALKPEGLWRLPE